MSERNPYEYHKLLAGACNTALTNINNQMRGSGRTTHMLKNIQNPDDRQTLVLARSEKEAIHILHQARKMRMNIEIKAYPNGLCNLSGSRYKEILLDHNAVQAIFEKHIQNALQEIALVKGLVAPEDPEKSASQNFTVKLSKNT